MSDVLLPQLGESVTEGTITRWFKQIGEAVAVDEVLFEVSTDKVDSEVPSSTAGVLTEILVAEGETVDVGTVVARLGSEAVPALVLQREAPAPHVPPPSPDPIDAAPAAAPESPAPAPEAQRLSPAVRRLVAEHGIDSATINGSGAGGRVTRSDVSAVVEQRPAPRPEARPTSTPGAVPAAAPLVESDRPVPFSNIRRRTAEHMVRSKATSPHALTAVEVDYHNVDAARRDLQTAEGIRLTYLPFVSRAVVDALREYPELNASVGHDELVVHRDIHLGYAVDLDFQGLMVPVVHHAGSKRLRALGAEVTDLSHQARARSLGADDLAGGTFTITNVGSYGTTITFPVINQPQVAILSTDGVRKRPVVVELADGTDAIAIRPVGWLALAWDHRAVDGAYAAAFLRHVKDVLESRNWESELA